MEQRIIALEDGFKYIKTMMFWLVTSSFATLASLVTGLIFVIIKG